MQAPVESPIPFSNRLCPRWVERRLAAHRVVTIDDAVVPRRAAVAMVFHRPSADALCRLLFIRRAEQEGDPWSGHMGFPGGSHEPEDASLLDTARRETAEEVGLDLEGDARLLGRMDDVRASAGGRVLPMAIAPFSFELLGRPQERINEEVQETVWVDLPHLFDPRHRTTVPYELAGERYELPGIDVGGRTIWGLTYQMLMRFFAVMDWR